MFIKLTASDGDAIWIRPDYIVLMYQKSDGVTTHIQINENTEVGIAVKETPEQILEIIKNVRN